MREVGILKKKPNRVIEVLKRLVGNVRIKVDWEGLIHLLIGVHKSKKLCGFMLILAMCVLPLAFLMVPVKIDRFLPDAQTDTELRDSLNRLLRTMEGVQGVQCEFRKTLELKRLMERRINECL